MPQLSPWGFLKPRLRGALIVSVLTRPRAGASLSCGVLCRMQGRRRRAQAH